MGCSYTRIMFCSQENEAFSLTEENIFGGVEITKLSVALEKHSTDGKLTKAQCTTAISEVGLDFYSMHGLVESLMKDDLFPLKPLICLVALLGSGIGYVKVHTLFNAYCCPQTKHISRSEISHLIKDLIHISCICIPTYVSSKFKEDESLKTYANDLVSLRNVVYRHYISQVLKKKKQDFSLKDFALLMESRQIKYLLYPKRLRKYCYNFYRSIGRPARSNTMTSRTDSSGLVKTHPRLRAAKSNQKLEKVINNFDQI